MIQLACCICWPQEAKRGLGTTAVFIARNRFAVLDKASASILVKDLGNEVTKKVPSPLPTADGIFYAGTGTVLVRSEDKVGCKAGWGCLEGRAGTRRGARWCVPHLGGWAGEVREVPAPLPTADAIFFARTDAVLVRSEDKEWEL